MAPASAPEMTAEIAAVAQRNISKSLVRLYQVNTVLCKNVIKLKLDAFFQEINVQQIKRTGVLGHNLKRDIVHSLFCVAHRS